MNLILLGAPGAGKGTQGDLICEKYGLEHISSGEVFRENINNNTDLGKQVKNYINLGQLVPDDITINMILNQIKVKKNEKGFLLDGFPRNIYQAQELLKHVKIDLVFNIDVDLKVLTKRLLNRRTCIKCGSTYNLLNNNIINCEKCGTKLQLRNDDKEDIINNRFVVYEKQTKPLVEFFKSKNLLIDINGIQSIDKIFLDIKQYIDKL